MLPQVSIWLLASLIAGTLLIAAGMRGRRINDRPICRACRFDLSGCLDRTARCPECGSHLKVVDAVRIGERKRRWSLIALGSLPAAVPLLLFGIVAWAGISATSLNTLKPLGLLLWEAQRADAAHMHDIATELLDRAYGRQLTPEQYARVISAALDHQADLSRPWAAMWGDVMEQGIVDGRVTDEQAKQFRDNATVLAWDVRSQVRQGDPLAVVIRVQETRIGGMTTYAGQTVFRKATIGGKRAHRSTKAVAADMNFGPIGRFFLPARTRQTGGVDDGIAGSLALTVPSELEPGIHEVRIEVGIVCDPMGRSRVFLGPHHRDLVSREWRGKIELLPHDAQIIDLIDPTPEITHELREALQPRRTKLTRSRSSDNINQSFGSQTLPVPVAFEVLWRDQHGQEFRIGEITNGESADAFMGIRSTEFSIVVSRVHALTGDSERIRSDVVDVILRPSLTAAARTVDLQRIYGGEIVFENVEIDVTEERPGFLERLLGG